jgi:hypothetical protein
MKHILRYYLSTSQLGLRKTMNESQLYLVSHEVSNYQEVLKSNVSISSLKETNPHTNVD